MSNEALTVFLMQVLTQDLGDGKPPVLLAVFWCTDAQIAAFQRNPTVINLDDTRMSVWVLNLITTQVKFMHCEKKLSTLRPLLCVTI